MKVKIMLKSDSPSVKEGEPTERYPVVLRVSHNNQRSYIRLGYFCRKNQWNGRMMATYPGYKDVNDTLNEELKRAGVIIQKLIQAGDVNIESFKRLWLNREEVDVWTYCEKWITLYKEQGRYNMYRDYTLCKNRMIKKGQSFRYYTYQVLKDFENQFRKEGCKDITIRHYFTTLRSMFGKAVKEGITDRYPFNEYRISDLDIRTHPRALSLAELKAIVNFQPPEHSTVHHAKMLFLFSFYTMGMNFADMAHLKSENIQRDRLVYKRQKTGQMYSVLILPPALEILTYFERYFPKEGYLLPILKRGLKPLKMGQRINSMVKKYNKALKDLAKGAGIDVKLTFYVARHTWATLMKKQGTPIAVISEGLGHTTEKTTQIYLDRFDHATLDQANELLLNVTLN